MKLYNFIISTLMTIVINVVYESHYIIDGEHEWFEFVILLFLFFWKFYHNNSDQVIVIIYWKFIFLNSQIFNNKIIKLILMIYILWFRKIHTDRQIFCDLFLFMNSCCCIYWTFDNKIQRKNLRFSFFFCFGITSCFKLSILVAEWFWNMNQFEIVFVRYTIYIYIRGSIDWH